MNCRSAFVVADLTSMRELSHFVTLPSAFKLFNLSIKTRADENASFGTAVILLSRLLKSVLDLVWSLFENAVVRLRNESTMAEKQSRKYERYLM